MKKINLIYEKFNDVGPLPNGLADKFIPTFEDTYLDLEIANHYNVLTRFSPIKETRTGYFPLLVKESGYDYEIKNINDINEHEINWLVIEPNYMDISLILNNCFSCLNYVTLTLIRQGIVKLVIYYAYEAFPLWQEQWIRLLEKSLGSLHIPSENVIFVFGDKNLEENYSTYLSKNHPAWDFIFENRFTFDHFEFEFQHYVKNISKDNELVAITNDIKPKPYRYLCLNGGGRQMRLFFLGELFRNDLNKYGLISYLDKYRIPIDYGRYTNHNISEESWHREWLNTLEPIILDTQIYQTGWHNRGMTASNYLDSYINIVTETAPDEPSFFITEKIFKPIVNLQPFIIVGDHGSLSYMHSLGYETFPEIFDESYDNIEDTPLRIKKLIEQVQKICYLDDDILHNLYESVYEKLKYNRNHFLNKSHSIEIDILLNKMIKAQPKPTNLVAMARPMSESSF